MTKIFNREYLKNRRKDLRNNSTPAEHLLWNELKHKKTGHKFRRQYSIGNYILDFYCVELKMCIELDGSSHDGIDAAKYDSKREKYLESLDISVVRFTNQEVYDDVNKVLERIHRWFHLIIPPSASDEGGENG